MRRKIHTKPIQASVEDQRSDLHGAKTRIP